MMLKLSLTSKLIIPFLLLILLFLFNDFYLSKQLLVLSDHASKINSTLSSIPSSLQRIDHDLSDLIARLERNPYLQGDEELDVLLRKIEGNLSENLIILESLARPIEIKSQIRELRDLNTAYVSTSLEIIYFIKNKTAQVPSYATFVNKIKEVKQSLEQIHQHIEGIVTHEENALQQLEEQILFNTTWVSLVVLLFCFILTAYVYLQLKPLEEMRIWLQKWLKGEQQGGLPIKGSSELRDLSIVLNQMSALIEQRNQELSKKQEIALHQTRLATIGKLAAQITHELRNPLSSIGLNSELLMDEIEALGSSQQRESAELLLREIAKEVDRLKEITEAYLHFARLPRPELQLIDLNQILQDVADFCRADCAKANVDLALDLEEVHKKIKADPNQIRSALLNLIRNAKEALMSQNGGKILLKVRTFGDHAYIEVKDNGKGFSQEALDHCFEPFFSTKPQGTGLGLAMVQQIVEAQLGKIEIINQQGALIRLIFPSVS